MKWGKRLKIMLIIFGFACLIPKVTAEAATIPTQPEALEWVNAQLNQSLNYDKALGYQCVDLIAYYYQQFGFMTPGGHAIDYMTNELPEGSGWERISYTEGFIPEPGDIAIWSERAGDKSIEGDPAVPAEGHVGIVVSSNSEKILVMDQNAYNKEYCSLNEYFNYTICGVIRPKFAPVFVETVEVTGKCGDNLTYTLWKNSETTYRLEIDGSGRMYDSAEDGEQWPWQEYKNSITELKLSNDITYLGENFFSWCGSGVIIDLPGSLEEIGKGAFSFAGITGDLVIPEKVRVVSTNAFRQTGISSVTFPEGLVEIWGAAFQNCDLKSQIKFPSTLKKIGDWAFYRAGLTDELVLPKGLEYIGEYSFWCNTGLSGDLIIPDSVSFVGYGAFRGDPFEYVVIPAGVELGGDVFRESNVGRFYLKGDISSDSAENAFYNEKTEGYYYPDGWATIPESEYYGGTFTWYKGTYRPSNGPDSYQVIYDDNGGDGGPGIQSKKHDEDILISKTKPVRKGYVFKGWATNKAATTAEYTAGDSYKKNEAITLYAVWKPVTYKIAFYKNGGTGKMSTLSAVYDKKITLPNNSFTRSGYKFKCWNTKTDGKGTSYSNKKIVKNLTSTQGKTVKLYAQWAKGYKLTYNANGGKNSTSSKTVYKGLTYGTLSTPSRTGYTFAGWYTKKTGGTKITSSTIVSTGKNHTIYAQWKKKKYNITYQLNGGKNNSKNKTYYYITTSTWELQAPTRTGYKFAGWYTSSSYKTKVTKVQKGSTGNKTFYAKWIANEYKITFNGNKNTSGSMKNTMTCKYGKTYTLTSNAFKRKGYTFVGWNTKADGSGKLYNNKASVKNLSSKSGGKVTLYAQWTKTKYKITYYLNGGKNHKDNPTAYYMSSDVITLKNPTKEGNKFVGWYTSSSYKTQITKIEKSSLKNYAVYAKWSPNKYSIQLDGNGSDSGVMNKLTSCLYGTEYTLPLNTFVKARYRFTGWNTKADGSGNYYADGAVVKNLTSTSGATVKLYAQWEENVSIAYLRAKFPDGKYWNHIAGPTHGGEMCYGDCNQPDSVTDVPCRTHNGIVSIGEYDCNQFDGKIQCKGFAYKLGYDAYCTTNGNVSTWGSTTDLSVIKSGDVLHYYDDKTDSKWGHWVMVIGVNGGVITVVEANFVENCRIKWDRTIDLNKIWNTTLYIAPYELK